MVCVRISVKAWQEGSGWVEGVLVVGMPWASSHSWAACSTTAGGRDEANFVEGREAGFFALATAVNLRRGGGLLQPAG
jgi:hypothetical protein